MLSATRHLLSTKPNYLRLAVNQSRMVESFSMSTAAPAKQASKNAITKVSTLTAISPIDGRYARQSHELREYFSEYALMRYRVFVELEWFKRLF